MPKKSQLQIIQEINPDLLAQYFATGECPLIPEDIRLFLQQLQWAAEIYETNHNTQSAAAELRNRIAAEQHVKIEQRTCVARIYEAINYFSINNNVSQRTWEETYANRFETLAKQALEADDFKTALKCTEASLECRRRSSDISEHASGQAIVFLISPEVTPELLGFERKSMKDIATKCNNGFYLNLIDSLPIESEDRARLLKDAALPE